MKRTKKDIYKSYGIEFDGNYIIAPIFGPIKPLLKVGNNKLGRQIKTFSMLAGTELYKLNIGACNYEVGGTCPMDCKGCYGKTGHYVQYSCKRSNAINTILVDVALDFVKRAIMAQIEADHIQYVRIHATGDFNKQEYIDMWKEITVAFPDVVFWTYTKNPIAENAFDSIPNCNVVKSVIPEIGLNFGKCGYILNTYNTLKANNENVYICRCGIDKNQHCTNCKGCSKHKYVLFIEHSTDYKANDDPLYDTLKAVIESQPDPMSF